MTPRFAAGLALALVAAVPAGARGAGFQLYEHGAAATGMVGAFTAQADDASAIFYNPAGLAGQRGLQVYVGSTLIYGGLEATGLPGTPPGGDADADAEQELIPLPTAYVTWGLRDDLAVGIGAFTQFGLATKWRDDWAGRFIVTDAELRSLTINPSVAWRPLSWLRLGGGVDITPASVELERRVDLVADEGRARFAGNAVGFGGNVGVLVTQPRWSFGLHYRSQYDLEFDEGVINVDVPAELQGTLRDAPASTTLPMPDVVSAGVGARPVEDLFVQLQLDWVNWSRLQEIRLTAPDAPQFETVIPQNWDDGITLRAGAELRLDRRWRVRAGGGYDWNPVPAETMTPIIPDSDRFFFSAGATADLPSGMTVSLSLMAVVFRERGSELAEFPARYENAALLTGLSISYRSVAP